MSDGENMTNLRLAKSLLKEYKLTVLLLMTLTVLWKLGFLNNIGHDWKQFSFVHTDHEIVESETWKNSPLWVEDQKPYINPHRYRYLRHKELANLGYWIN